VFQDIDIRETWRAFFLLSLWLGLIMAIAFNTDLWVWLP
jgi:hypothetical protein